MLLSLVTVVVCKPLLAVCVHCGVVHYLCEKDQDSDDTITSLGMKFGLYSCFHTLGAMSQIFLVIKPTLWRKLEEIISPTLSPLLSLSG